MYSKSATIFQIKVFDDIRKMKLWLKKKVRTIIIGDDNKIKSPDKNLHTKMMPIKVSGGSDGGSWMLMNGLLILKKYQFFYPFFFLMIINFIKNYMETID